MSQELDILGLLEGRVRTFDEQIDEATQRVYGVVLAQVSDLDDPRGLGRVKVTFPWLSTQVSSAWARVATAWAGDNRGTYLLPEIGDEALVAFQQGSLQHPYILGFLWSDAARPPEPTPRLDKRELRSRTGHRIVFTDLAPNQSLAVQSQGGHKIVLDDSASSTTISIADSSGKLSIVLDSRGGKVTIANSAGQVAVSAPAGKLSLDAANIDVHATGVLQLTGDSSVVVTGGTVKIN